MCVINDTWHDSLEGLFVSAYFVSLGHQISNEIEKNSRSGENTRIKKYLSACYFLSNTSSRVYTHDVSFGLGKNSGAHSHSG